MPSPSVVVALTVAAAVFGPWEKVSIQDIQKPVPEWSWTGTLGAPGPRYRSKPIDDACPIYDGGQIVGYSLACRHTKVSTPLGTLDGAGL